MMALPPDIIAGSLSPSQLTALRAFCSRRNSPYGYYATDLGASGAACSALERKGLLMGGNFQGERTRSYRWTDLGAEVFAYLDAQVGRNAKRQDPQGLGPKDEHAVAEGDAPNPSVPSPPSSPQDQTQ